MYKRALFTKTKELFQKFPVVALLGPRQSGKTILARECFSDLPYVNLEDLSLKELMLYQSPLITGQIIYITNTPHNL
jgi:predicted AAA+ superfamily ATPase